MKTKRFFTTIAIFFAFISFFCSSQSPADDPELAGLDEDDQQLVAAVEAHRINAINKVIGSVIAIYDEARQGGGSGVIIDPTGIALTNHHVIMGAGVEGWGGLADGKMYKWKLIGTDPGGDVSLIQMEGKDEFPFTPLGDSDLVRVGDWALAMGNPFILTEDQSPTVTLGIVSGIKRYQPGAGMNQLVYGNCIQVDSSINPGNSGGPLFNLNAEVIGINGRGSFQDRGRVNVGLGYAISANQIKNFIPDLMATKLVEHATLDANFSERQGKVVCSQLSLDSPVATAGLKLGDELISFEGIPIKNANQFTNLICTLPHDWPAEIVVRKSDGTELKIVSRCLGLPYRKPKVRQNPGRGDDKNPEQEKKQKRQRQMVKLLSAPSNEVRFKDINRKYSAYVFEAWKRKHGPESRPLKGAAKLVDEIFEDGKLIGTQQMWLAADGRIRVDTSLGGDGNNETFQFDGEGFFAISNGKAKRMSLVEAKLSLTLSQAVAMSSLFQDQPLEMFGKSQIDGAGKALGQNAYRIKLLDDDQDHFFIWLSMYGDNGRPAVELMKASAHKDCKENGGVTFSDWEQIGPVRIPMKRFFVSGLTEKEKLTISNRDAKWIDEVDESWFDFDKPAKVETPSVETESSDPDAPDPDNPFDKRNKENKEEDKQQSKREKS